MILPLSSLIPLRTTTVWNTYRAYQALPVGYGVCIFNPIAYNEINQTFLLLDHPIAGVDYVLRNNLPEKGYAWRNDLDSTGKAVSFLLLDSPLKVNEKLTVRLRGKLHPKTGEIIHNPADAAWDLLSTVCGIGVEEAVFDAFRLEAQQAGMAVHGLVNDPTQTIRAAFDGLMQSCGAIWAGAMPGIARLYPLADLYARPLAPEAGSGYQPIAALAATARAPVGIIYSESAGLRGSPGSPGANGTDGAPGTDGVDGKSAYQVAVDHGFTGTVTAWLASLKGADGAPGADGRDGSNGTNGTNGTNGADGADGHSPVLTWSGDQIAIDGTASGPHLTGPPGSGALPDPVDLSAATEDHALAVGETAYVDYASVSSVALHVQTVPGEYEIALQADRTVALGGGAAIALHPNNTTYASAFEDDTAYHPYGVTYEGFENTALSNCFNVSGNRPARAIIRIVTETTNKSTISIGIEEADGGKYSTRRTAIWNDTATAWTSLGTLVLPFTQSGRAIIRRIL